MLRLCVGLLLISAVLMVSCSGSRRAAPIGPITRTTALGDSVPYGTSCACTPYPQLTADDLAHASGHSVDVSNDAVPGSTSADLVTQLQEDSGVMNRVAEANVVTVEIGANDVGYSTSCGTNLACYEPELPAVQRNIEAIVARIHELSEEHGVMVVLLDYWNVWLGGSYAQAQGPKYVETADTLTDKVDAIISTIAHDTGSIYVDLRTAFKGQDHDGDETPLLAADGEHPNAEGHERIAVAVDTAIRGTELPN